MKIVTGNLHPDRKEEKLKKQFPAFYRFVLEHWFTLLRHSDYTIEYHVRPFSVEESRNVFATNPKNLSLEEMFRLALTCTPGSEAYNKIFMTAVQLFPDNPVANLNAKRRAVRRILSGESTGSTGNSIGKRCPAPSSREL